MGWIIGLLTFVLVLDCLFLILLVLIQLPKKETGIGQAFGGAATDALFGAGSGTALTKMTKYAAGTFFVLTFFLAILNAQHAKTRNRGFEEQMKQAAKTAEAPAAPAATNAAVTPPVIPVATTNLLLSTTTNAPASSGSNPPANPPGTKPK